MRLTVLIVLLISLLMSCSQEQCVGILIKNLSNVKDSIQINLKINDESIYKGYVHRSLTSYDGMKLEYLTNRDLIDIIVEAQDLKCMKEKIFKYKKGNKIIIKIGDSFDNCDSLQIKVGYLQGSSPRYR